jgi:hypothetical protein
MDDDCQRQLWPQRAAAVHGAPPRVAGPASTAGALALGVRGRGNAPRSRHCHTLTHTQEVFFSSYTGSQTDPEVTAEMKVATPLIQKMNEVPRAGTRSAVLPLALVPERDRPPPSSDSVAAWRR